MKNKFFARYLLGNRVENVGPQSIGMGNMNLQQEPGNNEEEILGYWHRAS